MRNWEALSIALSIRCTCWSAARLASAPYYTEAVAALRRHPLACDALGPPLRFKALNLGSKENCVTEERAHVREGGLQLPESAQHASTYFPVADHYFTTCIKVKWGEGVQTVWDFQTQGRISSAHNRAASYFVSSQHTCQYNEGLSEEWSLLVLATDDISSEPPSLTLYGATTGQ